MLYCDMNALNVLSYLFYFNDSSTVLILVNNKNNKFFQQILVHEDRTKCPFPYLYRSSQVRRHVRVFVYIESRL